MAKVQVGLGSDILKYGIAKALSAGSKLLTITIATRVLRLDEYGIYTLLVTTVLISSNISYTWLRQAVARYLPKYRQNNQRGHFEKQIFATVMLQSMLLVAAAIAFSYLAAQFRLSAILAAAFYFSGLTVFSHTTSILQARLCSRDVVIVTAAQAVVQAGLFLLIYFSFSGQIGLEHLLVASASSYTVALVLGFLLRLDLYSVPHLRSLDANVIREAWRYGSPMLGWVFAWQLLNLADRYLIGLLRTVEEVAIYSSVYDLLAGSVGLITAPILMASSPVIMSTWERYHNRDMMAELITNIIRYYLLVVVPVLIYSWVMAQEILSLFLPTEYVDTTIVPWIVIGFGLSSLVNYAQQGLLIAERTRVLLLIAFVAALVNVILNLLLISRYGYIVAAITTAASYLAYLLLVAVIGRKYLHWRFPLRSFALIVLAVLGSAWTLVQIAPLFPQGFPVYKLSITVLVFAVTYVGILFALGELRDVEKQIIWKVISLSPLRQKWNSADS